MKHRSVHTAICQNLLVFGFTAFAKLGVAELPQKLSDEEITVFAQQLNNNAFSQTKHREVAKTLLKDLGKTNSSLADAARIFKCFSGIENSEHEIIYATTGPELFEPVPVEPYLPVAVCLTWPAISVHDIFYFAVSTRINLSEAQLKELLQGRCPPHLEKAAILGIRYIEVEDEKKSSQRATQKNPVATKIQPNPPKE